MVIIENSNYNSVLDEKITESLNLLFLISGHVGWGISWYINGLLIPEINVVRGKTYTFIVEGGSDPEVPAKYHPFYITDDPVGGYEYKTDEEKKVIIPIFIYFFFFLTHISFAEHKNIRRSQTAKRRIGNTNWSRPPLPLDPRGRQRSGRFRIFRSLPTHPGA